MTYSLWPVSLPSVRLTRARQKACRRLGAATQSSSSTTHPAPKAWAGFWKTHRLSPFPSGPKDAAGPLESALWLRAVAKGRQQ